LRGIAVIVTVRLGGESTDTFGEVDAVEDILPLVFASMPVALPLKLSVPLAEPTMYCHVNVADAPPAIAWFAGVGPDTYVADALVPPIVSADGVTVLAMAPPVSVTVIVTVIV